MADQATTIPKGWKMTTLGEVAIFNYGKGLNTENRINGKIPVYGSSGITGYHNKPLVEESGYIIGRKGTVGSIYYSPVPFFPIDTVYYLIKEDIKTDFRYFYFLLRTLNLGKLNFDSAVPGLNRDMAYSLKCLIPEQEGEQRAIAAVLSSLDDKIELLREQNKTLEATAQAIFKEWFVNFNFPGTTGKMIDSKLGDIPEGWRVGRMNEFLEELESGKRPKGGVGRLRTGIPSVGAESINGISEFDFSKTKYVSEEFFNAMNAGKIKEYDILVYKDGGTPGTFLPRFSMTGEGFPFSKFAINEHVFRLQPKKDFQRFYLYLWLNSFYCKRELHNIGCKAAIPGINSTDFKNISLLIPKESTLRSYHEVMAPSFKKILINNPQIQTLSKLRDTLFPKLMNGEVRIVGFND